MRILWHEAFATALMVISSGSQLAGMSESACAVTPSNGHGLVRGPREPPAGNHGNENGTIATALRNDGTVTFNRAVPGASKPMARSG